jgi:hypothetical protein
MTNWAVLGLGRLFEQLFVAIVGAWSRSMVYKSSNAINEQVKATIAFVKTAKANKLTARNSNLSHYLSSCT